MFSMLSNCEIKDFAVLGPIPGTPLILSELSPDNALKSGICLGNKLCNSKIISCFN